MSPALRAVRPRSLRDALAALELEGWMPSRTPGGHVKLVHPRAPAPVFTSSTGSDAREAKNVVALCRRMLKGGSDPEPPQSIAAAPAEDQSREVSMRRRRKPRRKEAHPVQQKETRPVPVVPMTTSPSVPRLANDELQPVSEQGADTPPAPRPAAVAAKPAARRRSGGISTCPTATALPEIPVVDAALLDLLSRIRNGEGRAIPITADMVGMTLHVLGEALLLREGSTSAKKGWTFEGNARLTPLEREVLDALRVIAPMEASIAQATELCRPDAGPERQRSLQASVGRALASLHRRGFLEQTRRGRILIYRAVSRAPRVK